MALGHSKPNKKSVSASCLEAHTQSGGSSSHKLCAYTLSFYADTVKSDALTSDLDLIWDCFDWICSSRKSSSYLFMSERFSHAHVGGIVGSSLGNLISDCGSVNQGFHARYNPNK